MLSVPRLLMIWWRSGGSISPGIAQFQERKTSVSQVLFFISCNVQLVMKISSNCLYHRFSDDPNGTQISWKQFYVILCETMNRLACNNAAKTYFTSLQDSLRWRHNGCDSVSNRQPHHCLLNRLFRRRSKKTSKLRVTGLCVVNSPGTGEFSAQMASNAEKVSIWWRHHVGLEAHVKSPASRLSAQLFVLAQIKENIKAPRHWPLWGESTGSPHTGPVTQFSSNVSIWWRQYVEI